MTPKEITSEISTCPKSPNCVSTLTTSESHKMAPWAFDTDLATTKKQLKTIVAAMPRTELVSETQNTLYFVFTSKIFRFKDDVWLFLDETNNRVEFKSASRTGYSDNGVNRKRMDTIKSQLLP